MKQENILQDELVEDVEALDEELLEDDALEEALKVAAKDDEDDEDDEDEVEEGKEFDTSEDDGIEGNDADKPMKKTSAKKAKEPMAKKEDNFKDDLNALVESEATLSENFRDKASLIFESALRTKVAAKVNQLEEEYSEKLDEAVETAKEGLVEKVDSYLNYVVEAWAVENKIALETGIRADIAESFMSNLKNVFETHYVSVPEGKEDLVDNLSEEVAKLKEDYNAEVEKNIALQEGTDKLLRASIIAEATTDLSVAQADKLGTLLEGEDFINSEDFAKKVSTLKESYFKKDVKIADDVNTADESLKEETVEVSGQMASYLTALKTLNK